MLTLLSMLGGGLLRLFPVVLEFFKMKHDASHELQMTKLQLEIDTVRSKQKLDLAHAQAEISMNQSEMTALIEAHKSSNTATGIGWIDAISSTVRPFLTYYWCIGLYGSAKVIQVVVALQANSPLATYIPILITEFDQNVIASILAFWFVDRALRKK